MSAKMSQSALDINENMLLDNGNGCLQREDAVRFGISRSNNQRMKSKLRKYTRLITTSSKDEYSTRDQTI